MIFKIMIKEKHIFLLQSGNLLGIIFLEISCKFSKNKRQMITQNFNLFSPGEFYL